MVRHAQKNCVKFENFKVSTRKQPSLGEQAVCVTTHQWRPHGDESGFFMCSLSNHPAAPARSAEACAPTALQKLRQRQSLHHSTRQRGHVKGKGALCEAHTRGRNARGTQVAHVLSSRQHKHQINSRLFFNGPRFAMYSDKEVEESVSTEDFEVILRRVVGRK